ncbi:MAG: hypothetical protein RIB60_01225 [Phycisphaerales bacterium]
MSEKKYWQLDTRGDPVKAWGSFAMGLISLPIGAFISFLAAVGVNSLGAPTPIVVTIGVVIFLLVPIGVYLLIGTVLEGTRSKPARGICPDCGYNLWGLHHRMGRVRCPECGGEFEVAR